MIYPAEYDITILQNSTWSGVFRATQNRKELQSITITSGTPTFNLACHGLAAGDKVIFTGGDTVPCGISLNVVYYVIAANLTTSAFQVSTSAGGASIAVSGTAAGTFYVATPLNLTGYTVDADIKTLNDQTYVTSFSCSITVAADGQFQLLLPPAASVLLGTGRYGYDISLTSASGQRYYWLTGVATVQQTYSRN